MRSSSRVLAIGLAFLAVLLVAAWWSVRPGSSGRPAEMRDRAGFAGRVEPRDPEFELVDGAQAERAATDGSVAMEDASTSSSTDQAAQRARTGTLIVRIDDAGTRAPLAGIALRVVRERGGDKLLATGTTDERGEARFEEVEANTVIVEARRAPPHARAFGAAWLEGDETETVVLTMSPGRTVRGRVVDDVGTPLGGALVAANDDFGSRFRAEGVVASTDATEVTTLADGKFALDCLAPSPRDVWIESGEMAPRNWSPQGLQVRFEDARTWVRTALEPEAGSVVEDVGDVVVPRASTWSGRVVDARGSPIPGALVSARHDRPWSRSSFFVRRDEAEGAWPGLEGFRLRERESLCDEFGLFELRCRAEGTGFYVWTPAGRIQRFVAPAVAPGGRIEGLELRIDDATLLVIELVDVAGQRISEVHARNRGVSRPGWFYFGNQLAVSIRGDGFDTLTRIHCDPDGLFRAQIDGAVLGAAMVRVDLPGFVAVAREVEISAPEPARFVLEPLTALRLRVRFEEPVSVDPLKPRRIVLHACIEDPGPRRAARKSPFDQETCCGLGASRSIELAPGTKECELPVQADRPFFVLAHDQEEMWSQTFGPWRPGDSIHDIVVPELAPRVDREKLVARIRARVTDAGTGERIGAHIRFSDPAQDVGVISSWRGFAVIDAKGSGLLDAPAGRWRVIVRAEGYRSPPPFEVDFVIGVERDLGAFALERVPVVDILVHGTGADPVHIDFADPDARWIAGSKMLDDRLVVLGDLPARGIATVNATSESTGERVQRIAFEYDGAGQVELRLAPWRAVEVRCLVDTPSGFAASLRLEIVDPRFPPGRRCERAALTERAPDSDAWRFTGWLAPGTYVARAQSLVLGDCEARFEVPARGDDVIHVELRPTR